MAEANVNMKVEETTTESATEQPVEQQQAPAQRQVSLTQIPVNTENDALNMLVAFLQVAQKRGAFSLEEAGKIMESVNVFQRNVPQPAAQQATSTQESIAYSRNEPNVIMPAVLMATMMAVGVFIFTG